MDGDGDVDNRDGLLIDAFRSGYRLPAEGMGGSGVGRVRGDAEGARVALPSYQTRSAAASHELPAQALDLSWLSQSLARFPADVSSDEVTCCLLSEHDAGARDVEVSCSRPPH